MRIIFLDVDDPLIPTHLYFEDVLVSHNLSMASTVAIALMNRLCKISQAKIVMNITHNNNNKLIDKLTHLGIKAINFHEDCRTDYPNHTRKDAVDGWLYKHKNVEKFIIFDDVYFYDRISQIVIDFDSGIMYKDYIAALKHFELEEGNFML